MTRFVDLADAHRWAAVYRLSAAGLTRADVCGLRWSDLDLDAGTATISQGRTALASGRSVVDDPKSVQRRRVIPFEVVHPGTVARLRILRAQQVADRLAAGQAWTDTGMVLVDTLGHPVAPQVYSDHFRRIAAPLPPITLHQLRHSVAKELDARGGEPQRQRGLPRPHQGGVPADLPASGWQQRDHLRSPGARWFVDRSQRGGSTMTGKWCDRTTVTVALAPSHLSHDRSQDALPGQGQG